MTLDSRGGSADGSPGPGDRQLLGALDAVRPERLVPLLQQLLAVPSVTGSAAESELQHVLAARCAQHGLEVDLWPIDLDLTSRAVGFPGSEAERSEAWGLVGTWPGTDRSLPALVLNGHVDVVPLGDLAAWSCDPWAGEVRGGRVLGRGACDMKGGLVCLLVAVDLLREAGWQPRRDVALHAVVGEEDGGLGTFATLERGHHGSAAIIAEPTALAVIPASAGALTFTITVAGRSAHGSMREEGVDAVEKYFLVHQALRDLEARRNRHAPPLMQHRALPYPLSVGRVRAGDWASSVPDLLVAEGRYGVGLDESVQDARTALEECLEVVSRADPWLRENPVLLEWSGGQFAPGALAQGHPLLAAASAAHRAQTGVDPAVHGASYGSDLRLLTAAGIPTLHYGPGDIRDAHAPDESVPVDELVTATRVFMRMIAALAG